VAGDRTARSQKFELAQEMVSRLTASLDAHDSRTGTFLAGIAFMVTAGTAALTNDTIRAARFTIPNNERLPLPAFGLLLFLLFMTAAATYLVLSLGPPEPPPRPDSRLSLIRVASSDDGEWSDLMAANGPDFERARDAIYDNDVRYLSSRAAYKYGRLVEARAAFFLALPCLLIFIVLTLFVHAYNQRTLGLSWLATLACAAILLVTTFVAGQDRVRIDLLDQSPPGSRALSVGDTDRKTFMVLAICLSLNAALTFSSVMVRTTASAQSLLPILALVVTVPAAWSLGQRRRIARDSSQSPRVLDRLSPYAVILFAVPGCAFGLISNLRAFCMLAGFMPIALFEGIRLVDFYVSPPRLPQSAPQPVGEGATSTTA
jgi:hypothetical protein